MKVVLCDLVVITDGQDGQGLLVRISKMIKKSGLQRNQHGLLVSLLV
jgi:hypothetical protein